MIHETQAALKKLNEALSQIGIGLSSPSTDLKRISDNLAIAYQNTYFVDLAINSVALLSRDDYASTTPISEIRFFDSLHRNVKRMQLIGKQHGKRIVVQGTTNRRIKVFPCFDLLFYLFLDNAVKYSLTGRSINIDVIEMRNSLLIRIVNFGPRLTDTEIEKVVQFGVRGEMAEFSGLQGRGYGLPLAKLICDLHAIELKILPENSTKIEISGIPFAEFKVELIVPI